MILQVQGMTEPKRLRVLLTITGLGVGGAERQVIDLADHLSSLGHAVHIFSLKGPVDLRPQNKLIGITSLDTKKSAVGFFCAALAFGRILKEFRPDVVHSHMRHANIFTRTMRYVFSMPKLVCTSHTSNDGGLLWMSMYRFTDHLCDLTTSVSEAATRQLIEKKAVPAGKSRTVYNGIDVDRYKFDPEARLNLRGDFGIRPETVVFVAVGRLTPAKDYPNLLLAFKKMSDKEGDAQLWIVGAGPLEGPIRAEVKKLGLNGRCRFLGLRLDIGSVLSASDIFVLSSEWEGFGLVVAEAMACDRPVVVTDAFGVREVVGDAGIIVPTKDSQALSGAMQAALHQTPTERHTMVSMAHLRVQQLFSMEAVGAQWESIYRAQF